MSETKAQVSCLVSTKDGWQYMSLFDTFPSEVRQRVTDSPYNLCAACLLTMSSFGRTFPRAIEEMERQIRCQECPPCA